MGTKKQLIREVRKTKRLVGVLLAEVCRLQKRVDAGMTVHSDATIYGLLQGFDESLKSVVPTRISADQQSKVEGELSPIFDNAEKLASFGGYYDLDERLRAAGIDRGTASKIITFLKLEGAYQGVIAKMDSSGSPAEMRTFDVRRDDL